MAASAGAACAQVNAGPTSNCYKDYSRWLDSNATDCPLTAFGLTFYGTIDVGGGYESHASTLNADAKTGVSELVSKLNKARGLWQGVPSGLTQSNFGVKIKEQIVSNWFFIGDVNAGFDPFSLKFVNGPKSLVDNNNIPQANQSTNTDSARSTGWDNSRGYFGLSNPTFGTLTLGRQNAFSADLTTQYDPFAGSYAFSPLGNSSTFVAGTGDTEMSTYNTSVRYQVAYRQFRAGALTELGGFAQSNNAESAYQFDVGGDVGRLSVDAVYSYAKPKFSLLRTAKY